jgi:hypothetical protein
MPKPRKTLRLRLPPYIAPRLRWRRAIQRAATAASRARGVAYRREDRLELHVRLYLRAGATEAHDVDNRLKDVMDALQGRVGGPKRRRPRHPLIPSDAQVWRVVVEKGLPPKQSKGLGHLIVRRLRR